MDVFRTRGNLFFSWLPGCHMNPLFLLDIPLFLVLATMYRDSFHLGLLLPLAVMTIWREAIGMSVCLHRFFSHRGFQCSRPMVWLLYILGCQAAQGAPLWWSSKHRRHHQHCDTDGDPHSPVVFGKFYALLGWFYTVEGPFGRGVDADQMHDYITHYPELVYAENFAHTICCVPHVVMYYYWGLEYALFVSMASGIMSRMLSLSFNILYHTNLEAKGTCKATNGPYNIIGEGDHEWHHLNPRAYHRPGLDLPFYLFILPLRVMGLVWGGNIIYR